MDKAPDAFRTISEVAEELDLPQHVLRFWETRFSQIKPLKRGGGRRYYRPDDVVLLRGIRYLLYGEGYTIKGVQRILKENGVRAVQEIWQNKPGQEDEAADPAPLKPVPVIVELPPGASLAASEPVEEGEPFAEGAQEAEFLEEGDSGAVEAAEAQPDPPADPPPAPPREKYQPSPTVSIVRGGLQKSAAPEAGTAGRRVAAGASPSDPPAAGLSSEDVQTLKAVLYELLETRKGLDIVLNRR